MTNDPDWSDWSISKLEEAALKRPFCIDDAVYAELLVRYDRVEDLEAMLVDAAIEVAQTPRDALFLAGKVLCSTASRVARGPAFCRIFSSEPTPR